MDPSLKAAFVGLVGRPSCGKSTLINRICGNKVSIVSTVPQTTRNRVRGILSSPAGQLVFIDTPGFHLSERKFNRHLKELVLATFKEVDIILYLVDLSRPMGEEEQALIDLLSNHRQPLVIGLNKIDLKAGHLQAVKAALAGRFPASHPFPISGLTGRGLPELVENLFSLAPRGERLYPEEYYTDQSPEFRIAEIIREKAIGHAKQELPHALYVELSDLEMMEGDDLLWVRGFIYVERESQKGILVGKQGNKIKSIVREAEEELKSLFPYRVQLDLRVKVKPKWRKNEHLLKKLIC